MKYAYLIITILFFLCFDLWVENSEVAGEFYSIYLSPIFDEGKVSMVWLLGTIVLLVIVWRFHINEKNKHISELDKTLNSEMEILVKKNSQLSNYMLKDNISELLNNFVKSNPYVIAVQMYDFQDIRVNKETIFKFTLDEGVVNENVNINAIHQVYYKLPTAVFTRFEKAVKSYIYKDEPMHLLNFVIDAYDQLKTSNAENEEDVVVLSSLMFLGLERLEMDWGFKLNDLGANEPFFLDLMDKNRTGILRGSLIKEQNYTFTHTRENLKYNRQYITRLVKMKEQKTLFLTALDASVLEDDDYNEIMREITDRFEILLNDLEKMYNKNTER